MYQNTCNCGMGGLGATDWAGALIPLAATAVGGPAAGAAAAAATSGSGSGGSGAGVAPMGQQSTVSPQISTQISPQISPVFQQQFQPQNSAATAGTSQVLPAMPALNAPGIPGTVPNGGMGVPGYSPAPYTPQVPTPPINWAQYMPYALAGMGILAFVTLKKRGPKKAG